MHYSSEPFINSMHFREEGEGGWGEGGGGTIFFLIYDFFYLFI